MHWSLSEFLNLIELRGQSWCSVEMAAASGVSVGHGDVIFLHAVLEGAATLAGGGGPAVELAAGDVVLLTAGAAHALRNRDATATIPLDPLNDTEYVDTPPVFSAGAGPVQTRMLSGRLKVRWPGGPRPNRTPPVMQIRAADVGVDLQRVVAVANGPGGAALLTHVATVLFIGAFRSNSRCQALFRWDLSDPIERARLLIEKHSFQPWTVESLAHKVGMGRSNFAARFLAQVGQTPNEVLIAERMKRADVLLTQSSLKIAEVSEQVGYRSEAAFIRRYTNHFGMTPGKRRRPPT